MDQPVQIAKFTKKHYAKDIGKAFVDLTKLHVTFKEQVIIHSAKMENFEKGS